jgi:hypothetical protein
MMAAPPRSSFVLWVKEKHSYFMGNRAFRGGFGVFILAAFWRNRQYSH